jgi:hypothetical protein
VNGGSDEGKYAGYYPNKGVVPAFAL